MQYDRAKIMRRANMLRRDRKLSRSAALTAAWEEAREGRNVALSPVSRGPAAQTPGFRGACQRYGLDHLAERARSFVAELAALAVRSARGHAPRLRHGERQGAIDLRRCPDGVWRDFQELGQ